MFWKVAEEFDEEGTLWSIYNYYEIVDISTEAGPYYNGFTKEIVHPQRKQLVVRAAMTDNDEMFPQWWEEHKQL
jgi:hypothetical protein